MGITGFVGHHLFKNGGYLKVNKVIYLKSSHLKNLYYDINFVAIGYVVLKIREY